MGVAGSLMVIAIAWWLAFFAMLPFGVRSQLEEGKVVPGTDPGAPVEPKLLPKALWALVIALLLWGALFAVIEYRLFTIDDIPVPSGPRRN